MVYDFTIDFLRNALVKAPIAAFDVEDWNLPALRRNDGHTTIRIAENKHGIRSLFLQNFIYLGNDVARRLRRRTLRRIKIIVRRSHVKILKEHFVQFVIEILTCMNENMIDVLLEFRDDAGQLDDLRTRAHDSHDFCHTFSLKVSESSGSNISFAHTRRIISSFPAFVMLCACSTGMSTNSGFSPETKNLFTIPLYMLRMRIVASPCITKKRSSFRVW